MIRYEWAFILFSAGATPIAWRRDQRRGGAK